MFPARCSMILFSLACLALSDAHAQEGPAELQQAKAQHQKEDFALQPRERFARVVTIEIDDAQWFGWKCGYPCKFKIQSFVTVLWPYHCLRSKSDVIHMVPNVFDS